MCARLVEICEEGNRKIVDGVIRVGFVAHQPWTPRAPPRTPSRKKVNAGSPAPRHEQYIIYMSYG